MAKVNIQAAIAQYHQEMAHHGMEMHQFHESWHLQNPDPSAPARPDPNWGINNVFGTAFLQMHHEMVKATDDEPKQFMDHQSVSSWLNSKNYDLPGEWDPLSPIPEELAFTPTNPALRRRTSKPEFRLPNYFTPEGIGPSEHPEPITRARSLSDFKNINQLGCCIVYPHNQWHNLIGGAMRTFANAIDDPVFYFGVHWHIDKVYDLYKAIKSQLKHVEKTVRIPEEFTEEELEQLKTAEQLGFLARIE